MRGYIIRNARQTDIPAIRAMQARSMWVLGGDFYEAGALASFLTEFGTMDDAIVDEGHFFVVENDRGAILGSGGWSRYRPGYANGLGVGGQTADGPTVRSVFVDPAAARRGIASAIMLRIERDAAEHEIQTLHLTATLSGVALYEHLGYRTEEATAVCLSNQTQFACVRMAKRIPKLREQAA
ncbi:GNAT family N-acetyltransferase [Allomesorhizobium camelthorni]|uniref:GNAT family N-acetyltransferase n=1 Tax=Allomesorhizobium camelthorni TaxID=475069 RepID=A0A6G4WKC0_9HYPH|nr:GNAT family N-acetyltransferase [Mesorhizobium camelthorni]NGO54798.1 GNAT family N-acetyltransferase [Mesorhizobium camelthorni]